MMKTQPKLGPQITSEVMAMMDLRRQAEQRGHFEPLGRLVSLQTDKGSIEFPAERGEGVGPDLARGLEVGLGPFPCHHSAPTAGCASCEWELARKDSDRLLVLGAWSGLPALRKLLEKPRFGPNGKQLFADKDGKPCSANQPEAQPLFDHVPCKQCRHACDICTGSGKKQCEGMDCGGRGYILGNWLSCPGPGCHADTGNYKADCATCANSPIRGQIREQIECPMCKGAKLMTCSRCRGTGKFSTGKVNGSLDWRLPACKFCDGTGFKGVLVKQDVKQFTNAKLVTPPVEVAAARRGKTATLYRNPVWFLVLGPIYSFTLRDFHSGNLRIFDVHADAAGDYLVLMVPQDMKRKPCKAYLVGGIVRERAGGEQRTA